MATTDEIVPTASGPAFFRILSYLLTSTESLTLNLPVAVDQTVVLLF
jgi:hypothetical protein